MSRIELVVAVLAGIVQGVVEWLPVSSQGNLALVFTAVGTDPGVALQLALFLQVGTTLSAATYYREEIQTAVQTAPGWRPGAAYDERNALVSYIVVACLVTGLVGVPLYVLAVDLAGELTGGVFVALVVTTSALLFRGYDPPVAFHLSFLLSIPASLGAAALTIAGAGGLPGISPTAAVLAVLVSGVVGYAAIDLILRVVARVPFWQVCFGLGGVAILGGALAVVAG